MIEMIFFRIEGSEFSQASEHFCGEKEVTSVNSFTLLSLVCNDLGILSEACWLLWIGLFQLNKHTAFSFRNI